MRPPANNDHHTVFFLQAPCSGVQHFTFHFAGASEVLKNGWEFVRKGYKSFWGPGRHVLGSNYFRYFNGCFYDARYLLGVLFGAMPTPCPSRMIRAGKDTSR